MDRSWIVSMEAAGDPGDAPISQDTLKLLMQAMSPQGIVALYHPHRYALQLRVVSASPAEALFLATAAWSDAIIRLGLERWSLRRAEVMTPEEFDADTAAGVADVPASNPGVGGEGSELLRRAFHDPLTGLPTLPMFRDQALRVIATLVGYGRRPVLLVVDVDGIRAVNAALGQRDGDRVLVELTARVTRQADAIWAAARLVGGEFALLVDDRSAVAVADGLLAAFRPPVVIAGRPVLVTASVGIAEVNVGSGLDECLCRAGTAMCAAKEAGGDRYRWYEPGLAVDRARLDFAAQSAPDRLGYVALMEQAALVANHSSTMEDAAAFVLRQVLAHTGWLLGHMWLVDHGTGRLEPAGVWQSSGLDSVQRLRSHIEGASLAPGSGLPAMAWETGQARWASLTGNEPRCAYQEAAQAAGVAAAAAFPVLVGAEVVAVLGFCSTLPISPDDSLLGVMLAVAAQLGRVFERRRAEAALAEAEQRYRRLVDAQPDLIGRDATAI